MCEGRRAKWDKCGSEVEGLKVESEIKKESRECGVRVGERGK